MRTVPFSSQQQGPPGSHHRIPALGECILNALSDRRQAKRPWAKWRNAEYYWPVVMTADGVEYDVDRILEGTAVETIEGDVAIYPDLVLPKNLTLIGNASLAARVRLPGRFVIYNSPSA